MLAHHYVSALELSKAAGLATGAIEERARLALRDAGDRASSLSAFGAAARFYGSALELWPEDAERPSLLFRLGGSLWAVGSGGRDELTEAYAGLLELGDVETAAEAAGTLGQLEWMGGRREAATAELNRGLELLRDRPATPAKVASSARLRAPGPRGGPRSLASARPRGRPACRHARGRRAAGSRARDARHRRIPARPEPRRCDDRAGRGDRARDQVLRARAGLQQPRVRSASRRRHGTRPGCDRRLPAGRRSDRRRRARALHARRSAHCVPVPHGRWDEVLRVADEFLTEIGETSHCRRRTCDGSARRCSSPAATRRPRSRRRGPGSRRRA